MSIRTDNGTVLNRNRVNRTAIKWAETSLWSLKQSTFIPINFAVQMREVDLGCTCKCIVTVSIQVSGLVLLVKSMSCRCEGGTLQLCDGAFEMVQ